MATVGKRFLMLLAVLVGLPFGFAFARSGPQKQIEDAFRPWRTEQMTLAPSGGWIAYTLRNGSEVSLVVADVNDSRIRRVVATGQDRPEAEGLEETPVRLSILQWTDSDRLIFAFGPRVTEILSFDTRGALAAARNGISEAEGAAFSSPDGVVPLDPVRVEVKSKRRQFLSRLISEEEARFVVDPTDEEDMLNPQFGDREESVVQGAESRPGAKQAQTLQAMRATSEGYTNPDGSVRLQRASNAKPIHYQRSLRFVQLGANSDEVLIEAAGGSGGPDRLIVPTTLFKIDARSGKRSVIVEQPVLGRALYDRQGRFRILLQALDKNGMQEYLYAAKSDDRQLKQTLDQFLGRSKGRSFAITVANYLKERSFPLGFDYDPDAFYYASNIGRDTYGIYVLNLTTKQSKEVVVENDFDLVDPTDDLAQSILVFDRSRKRLAGIRIRRPEPHTRWIDPELAQAQAALDQRFATRKAQIVEWDDTRSQFLVLVSASADPGRYGLYDRKQDRWVDLLRRAPGFEPHKTVAFAFDRPDGKKVTGVLTCPREAAETLVPLVIYCPDGPWQASSAHYDRTIQALVSLGVAVAQINYRGSAGFGRQHILAAQGSMDRAPLEDIAASIDWLSAQHLIDKQRVGLVGQGLGGYIAARGLQLHPEIFRCAVVMRAPFDLAEWFTRTETLLGQKEKIKQRRGWRDIPARYRSAYFYDELRRDFFGGQAEDWKAISPIHDPAAMTKPLMIIDNSAAGETEAAAARFREALVRLNCPVEYVEIDPTRRSLEARAEVLIRIGGFLMPHLR